MRTPRRHGASHVCKHEIVREFIRGDTARYRTKGHCPIKEQRLQWLQLPSKGGLVLASGLPKVGERRVPSPPHTVDYRGTSLIRNIPPVGPYSSSVPRDLGPYSSSVPRTWTLSGF